MTVNSGTHPQLAVLPSGRGLILGDPGASDGTTPSTLLLEPDLSVMGASAITVPMVSLSTRDGARVLWSGSLAERDGGGVFDEHPLTWGPQGWRALESAIVRMRSADVGGGPTNVCIRPHARHIISDVPGCKHLLACEWAAGVSLLIDPMSMLTPAMLGSREAEDHLRRMFEMVAELDPLRVRGVIVSGGVVDPFCGVRPAALGAVGAGTIQGARVLELAQTCLPAGTRWMVFADDLPAIRAGAQGS